MQDLIKHSYTHISIFPEGTVAATGKLMRFKKSVFTLGVPVHPVTIKYYCPLNPCWTTHHWAAVVFNLIVNPFGLIKMTYHPPM